MGGGRWEVGKCFTMSYFLLPLSSGTYGTWIETRHKTIAAVSNVATAAASHKTFTAFKVGACRNGERRDGSQSSVGRRWQFR